MSQLAIEAYEAAINSAPRDHAHWNVIEAEWTKVKAKYPQLFKARDLGTLVGPGWWPILEEAMISIVVVLERYPDASCQVQQIKEKFGGLRFYVQLKRSTSSEDGFYADIQSCIRTAEAKAARTCEACGSPGTLGGSWLKTYCDKHKRKD